MVSGRRSPCRSPFDTLTDTLRPEKRWKTAVGAAAAGKPELFFTAQRLQRPEENGDTTTRNPRLALRLARTTLKR